MARTLRFSGWLLAGLLVLWFSYAVVYSAPSFQECIGNAEAAETGKQIRENPSIFFRHAITYTRIDFVCTAEWAHHYEGVLTMFATLVIAMFTFTLWRSTDRLWDEAREAGRTAKTAADAAKESANAAKATVSTMNETAERELRAYLGMAELGIDLKVGQAPRIRYKFRNYGKTPAYGLTVNCGVGIGPSFDTLPIGTDTGIQPSNAALPPGEPQFGGFDSPYRFTQEFRNLLDSGEMHLWVYGKATWRDAFNIHRFKTFRHILIGENLVICNEGNDEN